MSWSELNLTQIEVYYASPTALDQLMSAAVSTANARRKSWRFLSVWLWQPRLNGGIQEILKTWGRGNNLCNSEINLKTERTTTKKKFTNWIEGPLSHSSCPTEVDITQ